MVSPEPIHVNPTSSQHQADGRRAGLKIRSSQEGVGSSPTFECGEQFSDLLVDGGGILQGARDLLAEEGSVARAEPMRGSPGGPLRAAQIGGDAGIGEPFGGPKEGRFQCRKRRRLAGGGHLGLEPSQDVLEQRCGPLALEEPLGREVMGRLAAIAILGGGDVDRHDGLAAAALEPPLVIVAVGQVVRARGHQERAEPPLAPVDRGQALSLQQSGEEALDEILGRFRVVPPSADERIERVPVRPAELGQRVARPARIDRPPSRSDSSRSSETGPSVACSRGDRSRPGSPGVRGGVSPSYGFHHFTVVHPDRQDDRAAVGRNPNGAASVLPKPSRRVRGWWAALGLDRSS